MNSSAARMPLRTKGSLCPYYNMYYKGARGAEQGSRTGIQNGSGERKPGADTAGKAPLAEWLALGVPDVPDMPDAPGTAARNATPKSNTKSNAEIQLEHKAGFEVRSADSARFRKRMEFFVPMEAFANSFCE